MDTERHRTHPDDRDGVVSTAPLALPPVLYHYCSEQAFRAIVNNGCVWASDAAHMNDALEGVWLDEVVKRIEEPEWDDWRESGHILHDYRVWKTDFYIACLSEKGDLLSQWRSYADDGRGASIGLGLEGLEMPTGLSFTDVFHMSSLGCTIDRVVYDEASQDEVARRVFRYVDHLMRSAAAERGYFYDAIVDTGRDCLAYVSKLLKHPGFSEEQEWRLIYDGKSDRRPDQINSDLKHRFRGKEKIGYFEFSIRSATQLLREVVLGPKSDLSVEETAQLLRAAGYRDVEIRRSMIPYR